MTPKERAAMQQALMYLEAIVNGKDVKPYQCEGTVLTLREALEQPVSQEPSIDFDKLHEMDMQYVECPACGSDMARAYSPKQTVSQEPVAYVAGYYGGRCVVEPINRAAVLPTGMAFYTAPQPVSQEPVKREHITDGSPCWCNPELNYKDPETGAEVWVHKEPQ